MVDPLLHHSAALLLAAVFAIAAWGKLAAPAEFEGVVGNYRLLPKAIVRPVALALPAIEVAAAVLVTLPMTREAGAVAIAALLVVFAAAMAVNILRGRVAIDCGCFRTTHRQYLSWWLVGRNGVLLVFALGLLLPGTGRSLGWLDLAQLALAVPTLLLIYAAASGAFLPRPPTFDENYARTHTP